MSNKHQIVEMLDELRSSVEEAGKALGMALGLIILELAVIIYLLW